MDQPELKMQEREFLTLNRLILTVVFVLGTLIMAIVFLFREIELNYLSVFLAIFWSLYFLIFLYKGAEYRHYRFAMDDCGLYINSGVFWRKKIVVPRNRVQHTDIMQGPLDRQYNLAELVIHTAGTRSANVKLQGLFYDDAEKLRESLSFENSNDAV